MMKLKLIIVTLLLTAILPSAHAGAEEYIAGFKFDAQDYDSKEILYRIVEAEAGGQLLSARKNVASVVINRVNDNDFPNSIFRVIMQKGQFASGRIWKVEVTDRTRQAVDYVLAEGLTTKALYFSTRRHNRCFRGLDYIGKDSAHYFFK